jgi:hypothetical protein
VEKSGVGLMVEVIDEQNHPDIDTGISAMITIIGMTIATIIIPALRSVCASCPGREFSLLLAKWPLKT